MGVHTTLATKLPRLGDLTLHSETHELTVNTRDLVTSADLGLEFSELRISINLSTALPSIWTKECLGSYCPFLAAVFSG